MNIRLAVAVLGLCAAVSTAGAAEYPGRSIRYIVPQGAGGSSDTLARLVTQKLSESLGQQVVVDNRPGATGNIGTEIAARAAPDGYTLLQVATSLATNPALSVKMPFDAVRDFAPITLLSQSPNLWIVHPSLPARNMRELIALAKTRPGEINYSSSGTGSSQHLAGELLKSLAHIDIVHIPYKGSPPALIDLLGGRVVLMCSTIAPAMPLVKSGKLHALAVTSLKRSAAAPAIPTVAESGLAGYEATAWQGVLAPAGTPREIITRLNTELVRVVNQPEVRRQLSEQGYEPAGNSPEQFAEYIKTEIAKWTRVIKAAGLKAE
ncbi:MAG: tripartite tricarboxylate transporter substrate binding protein [Burkholderiales bacterium]